MIPFFRFSLLKAAFLSLTLFSSDYQLCVVEFLKKVIILLGFAGYAPRWLYIISYPARPRRIIVNDRISIYSTRSVCFAFFLLSSVCLRGCVCVCSFNYCTSTEILRSSIFSYLVPHV